MGDPIVYPDDLATLLNDPSIQADRARHMIDRAQALCESILSPLPIEAAGIVERVAARGYVSAPTTRAPQLVAAGSPFSGAPGGAGGVYLTKSDRADLRRLAGGGGAFSVDMLPSTFALSLLPWNTDIGFDDPTGLGDWDTPV